VHQLHEDLLLLDDPEGSAGEDVRAQASSRLNSLQQALSRIRQNIPSEQRDVWKA
jgi:hypothetical protein